MAFPHPKSRQDKDRNGDEPNHGSVVWKFGKRAIDIADNRDAKDDMDPAKNRTFSGVIHRCSSSGEDMQRAWDTTSRSISTIDGECFPEQL